MPKNDDNKAASATFAAHKNGRAREDLPHLTGNNQLVSRRRACAEDQFRRKLPANCGVQAARLFLWRYARRQTGKFFFYLPIETNREAKKDASARELVKIRSPDWPARDCRNARGRTCKSGATTNKPS